ncbi:hypothetical protein [Paragemmobacter straminiformis]|uniref:Uncharacterized protein n=1 Tax=Paragemmobacter straminiformis TaxID=2045119 RepID=A0A842I9U9_9RHOB|nr:hypothetical protein [Gemmobacter straminiformis]MBC2836822.1 hypothetical protein [Gemmobacter straminiformis]
MSVIALETGAAAIAPKSLAIDGMDFGYNYSGFRPVDRFENQLADNHVGLITWPGGTLCERSPDRYGFQFDGLYNPALNRPGLAEMFQIARAEGAGLSVVLPTVRYEGDDAALRADVHDFMGKLLGGHYGPLPDHLQLEVGNEWYVAFGSGLGDAAAYGHVADIYVQEMARALEDPSVNLIGADVDIAVQCGRTLEEDEAIRAEFHGDDLAEVDMVIHHRFALSATGVDRTADEVGRILDAWETDAAAHGGDRPELFLGTYNVGSLTRDEALDQYIKAEADLGHVVRASDIDLEHRTDAPFERFWQDQLGARDYGPEHPRLLLEMFAEYGGEGMGGAGVYGVDMVHAGRFTTQDAQGHVQDFVAQDMLDMLAESTQGTRLLKIGLTNDRGDDVWAYGFENEDKLVVFLSADDLPPGTVTLAMKGVGTTYKAVYGESLTAKVPDDWMTRFDVPDNAQVDETNEGRTYAVGVRHAVTPTADAEGVTVALDQPYEVVRLSFAKTDAGLREIGSYSHDHGVELAGPLVETTEVVGDPAAEEDAGAGHGLGAHHDTAGADPVEDGADHGGDLGIGGLLAAFVPLLLLLGGGI